MTTYAIKDWDQTFENRLSRRLETLRYVSITNKQDADAFVQLMRTPSGIIAYGIFIALVQIGSKCPERGKLTDDKGDWTPARFARRFGTPAKVVETAFDLLMSPEIGWLVDANTVQSAHANRTPSAHDAHTARTSSAQQAQPTEGGTVVYGKVRESKVRETRKTAATPLGVFPKALDTPAFREAWADWKDDRKANRRKPLTPKGEAIKLAELASWGEADAIAGIKASIGNGWQGIFRPGGSEATPTAGPDKFGCYDPLNFPEKTDAEVCAFLKELYPDTFVRQPLPGELADAVR
jgi:hypothetical protein